MSSDHLINNQIGDKKDSGLGKVEEVEDHGEESNSVSENSSEREESDSEGGLNGEAGLIDGQDDSSQGEFQFERAQ